jgi:UDP-GlcNAc3NAcA epimerase
MKPSPTVRRIRIVSIVGARPQFVKLAPIARRFEWLREQGDFDVEHLIVHTGQHYDPVMSAVFFDELGLPAATVNLGVGSGPHGRQTAAMLDLIEQHLQDLRPDAVIVYGDTNSTLAGALAASKMRIPLAHVEAGLRSYNRAMPEELNRVATDHMADLLLVPTRTGMSNLLAEGLSARACFTGDVMYDAVLHNRTLAAALPSVARRFSFGDRPFAAVTIHRAENTTPQRLIPLVAALRRVADEVIPLLFLVHPRTAQALRTAGADFSPRATLRLIEPVGYLEMLRLLEEARLVLTDSGGLQKEAFFLGCPCVTLREESEWPETLEAGANQLAGTAPEAILAGVQRALAAHGREQLAARCAEYFGDGAAAHHIVAQVVELAAGVRGHG